MFFADQVPKCNNSQCHKCFGAGKAVGLLDWISKI